MRNLLISSISVIVVLAAAFVYAADTGSPELVTDSASAIVKGRIVVKGEGAAPIDRTLSGAQRKILAVRAAKIVAFREAVEIVDGVIINGETTVEDASAGSDIVRSSVMGLVKGGQVIKETYDPVTESALVYLSVPLTGENGIYARLLDQVLPSVAGAEMPVYSEDLPEAAVTGNFDGLVIDVRELDFRPALINRVVTGDGEVVYDPSKVARGVLTDTGAAGYTNDIEKAKALLSERGSTRTAVIKATGLANGTDVVISSSDASAINSSTMKSNFLEKAMVVFVLR